ncbi:helix-turn-helix domain-containing protein [Kordia sp. YSTF-M3]|uniref:Helix-turn-helix domain-containing protein n=1 Tax=Kordia aestuariivivens TaxID=2759037 RepID=A0ABR7QBT4_9FLAO|nr:helix-turn-helix domain-containing protein [Kordia aestuariivivens]MBC8755973.1 helix-turn-helix domain-containing protein [Kordia aestuariivivens]
MNNNPFEIINERLSSIENLLLDIKQKPVEEEKSENLTVKETAEFLKISTQSVYAYIKRGLFTAQKVGRLLLINRADLEASLKDVKSLKYKRS